MDKQEFNWAIEQLRKISDFPSNIEELKLLKEKSLSLYFTVLSTRIRASRLNWDSDNGRLWFWELRNTVLEILHKEEYWLREKTNILEYLKLKTFCISFEEYHFYSDLLTNLKK